MQVGAYLRAVQRLARDADGVLAELRLPKGEYALNVHGYARGVHARFVRANYATKAPPVSAVAMNPGRNGAVQTGIPFTDREWAEELVPGFDRWLRRPPRPLPKAHREASGRRLLGWARHRWGDPRALHRHVFFHISCPIAVLAERPPRNVPLPELSAENQRLVMDLILRHVDALLDAASPKGILLLGRWAERVWDGVRSPRLRKLPVAAAYHPAAHVNDTTLFASFDKSMDVLAHRIR